MDASLIAFLLAAAVRITGLPPVAVDELPSFFALPASELQQQVCPDGNGGCVGIAAYFDALRYRILYSDSLDLDNPVDHSFLLHEIVHALQHRQYGNAIYADCRALVQTERQAYRAQDIYLGGYGLLTRTGSRLASLTRCP